MHAPFSSRAFRRWIGGLLLILVAVTAAQEPERTEVRKSGQVKGIRGPLLYLETEGGEQLLVRIPERPENLFFEGAADGTWLRPGMLVQFRAALNKRGQAAGELNDLLVFSPRPDYRLGIFPETGGGTAGNLFSDEPEKTVKRPKPSNEPVPCLVAGPVRNLRRNRIAVVAGNTVVEAELAKDAKIRFDLTDLSLVSPGDSATVEGWAYADKANQVYANKLTVSATQTLTLDTKILKQRALEAKQNAPKGEPKPKDDKETKDDKDSKDSKTEGEGNG